MMFKSPLRKNYLLNNQPSIITERHQEDDSNSRSNSRSKDSINKKSPNNSFQKIKRDQVKKNQDTLNKIQSRVNILNRNNVNNSIKLRSQSITTAYNKIGTSTQRYNQNLQQGNQKNKTSENFTYESIVIKKNSKSIQQIFKEPVKLGKLQSQISEISTQQPLSFANNFIIEDQRPGFVRFSQCIIENKGNNNKKSVSGRKGSLSILKNKKNAISCNKIDSSYLKFRDKNLNQKQKPLDVTKTKYRQLIEGLREKFFNRGVKRHYSYFDLFQEEKYKDQLFPANIQSLFYSKTKLQEMKNKMVANPQFEFIEISWKRISELFHPSSKLVLYKQNSSQRIIKNQCSLASNQFILSLNAIKNVSQYFVKVFESSCDKYEKHGAYCLKIFQQNIWKSIIVDDLIPIVNIKNKKTQQITNRPLFLDIQCTQNGQEIQIWPFLIQKAYSSYYNSYESLNQNFKIVDWLQQILMTPSECYYFPDNEQLSEEAVKKLQKNIYDFPSSQSIIVGFNIKTKQPCIIQKRQSNSSNQAVNQQITIKTLKSERKMKIKHLLEIIHTFYLFLPFHFKYFNTCPLNFNKSGKKSLKQHPMSKIKYRDEVFIRTFNVQEDGPFSITVRQKEKRFYLRSIKKYDYLWIRAILVQKQFGNTYRWIQGKYSNEKGLNFNLYLQKGQYEIIIMPQCLPQQILHDLTMIVLSNTQIGIERKLYEQGQKLIEAACCDIAQRKGNFKQLNESTCSYSFIQKSTGMIIENINNEKSQGGVAINRSLTGIKAKVQIYPFNIDFCINEYETNIHKRKYKKTIEVLIDADNHFTVVLMMKGGIDEKFFKVFKFGY